jgi:hypothetical protein
VRELRAKMPEAKIRRKHLVQKYHLAGEKLNPTTVTRRAQQFYKVKDVEAAIPLVPADERA